MIRRKVVVVVVDVVFVVVVVVTVLTLTRKERLGGIGGVTHRSFDDDTHWVCGHSTALALLTVVSDGSGLNQTS